MERFMEVVIEKMEETQMMQEAAECAEMIRKISFVLTLRRDFQDEPPKDVSNSDLVS